MLFRLQGTRRLAPAQGLVEGRLARENLHEAGRFRHVEVRMDLRPAKVAVDEDDLLAGFRRHPGERDAGRGLALADGGGGDEDDLRGRRSEEHTYELQALMRISHAGSGSHKKPYTCTMIQYTKLY